MERRGLVKGNSLQRDMHRMQGRARVKQALGRIRQAAEREKGGKLTSLMHHIYAVDTLREAYYRLEREAAPGVDGITWRQYGEDLETNLQDLSGRLARGAYRASPVRRVYVPKPDGRQRPIGVPALEDKIVQRATVAVLNQVYEVDFLDFSYGLRPGRSPHDALEALDKAIWNQKVNWVLDADVRSFFDAMVHEWAVTFVQMRKASDMLQQLAARAQQQRYRLARARKNEGDPGKRAFVHALAVGWMFLTGRKPGRNFYATRNPFLRVVKAAWADAGFCDHENFLRALESTLTGLAYNEYWSWSELGRETF